MSCGFRTRGVGGLGLRCPRSVRGRVVLYRPSSLYHDARLQTPRARPLWAQCGCIPCGVPVSSIDSGLYPEQDYVPDAERKLRLISCCYLRCCFWLCLLVRILPASRLAQRSGTAGKSRKIFSNYLHISKLFRTFALNFKQKPLISLVLYTMYIIQTKTQAKFSA